MDMSDPDRTADLRDLRQLNRDYLHSDQHSDVARYEEILAPDFTASLPDHRLYSRAEFLEMIALPRPFTDLEADDVVIRILGDHALVHGHITFTDLCGAHREGRYTDDWQRRDGEWMCIAANVIADDIPAADEVAAIEHVFTTWHAGATEQDADTMADLYAPEGVIETPAAFVLSGGAGSGEVRGREAIRAFFAENFAARVGDGVFEGWWRAGDYFTDGNRLIWEYPRETPHGEQTDLVESMDIENGLITRHRVYWGWVGFTKLHAAATAAAVR